jgi:hypothetical protein
MHQYENLPSVLYIAGYGRSGSTILDMMLGLHQDVFGAGELAHIFLEQLENHECSCGRLYGQCAFWHEVRSSFMCALPGVSLDQAARITRSMEGSVKGFQLLRGLTPPPSRQYADIWRAMLGAIGRVAASSVVVDSSKSTRLTAGRALALAELCRVQVKAIHLVRDPRAVVWSALRGSNRKLEAGEPARIRGGICRILLSWILTNLCVEILSMTNRIPILRIRYEDLVSNPVGELGRISGAFALDLAAPISVPYPHRPLQPGHGVAGNRLRRNGIQHLHMDDEWKSELPSYAMALSSLSWPLANRYGYTLHHVR